ncbi:hypothetical protein [Gordonia iterans]
MNLGKRLEAPMSRRAGAAWWVCSTALVAAALAFVVSVSLWWTPVAARVHSVDELQEQAGSVVSQVFSARAESWRDDRARARELVTGSFAATLDAGLSADAPPGVRSVRWEPVQVGVVDAQRDVGTALIVVHVVVTPTRGEPTAQTKSVNADFERHHGRWLLSGLDELQ